MRSGPGIQHILKTEGPAGLYKGSLSTAIKQGGSNGVRFLFMAEWTRLLKGSAEATLRPAESFIGGMVSGLAAVLSTQPMDVVKTRLQSAGGSRRYAGTLDCLKQIVRDEGAGMLYSGTIARAARVLPGSGIIFMSAELIYNALLSRRRSPP